MAIKRSYYVKALWDDEAQVFWSESDIKGLHIEPGTLAEFENLVGARPGPHFRQSPAARRAWGNGAEGPHSVSCGAYTRAGGERHMTWPKGTTAL